jgi:hypothetical protein
VLKKFAPVKPNIAFSSDAQEAMTGDYPFLARHRDFISLQQFARFDIESELLEDLALDGIFEVRQD